MISPVFPRIQLNDTEKATSRAPPRNKSMAICNEIPSSYGFGLPLPPGFCTPSISSIQGYGGHEKNDREMRSAEPLAYANCTTSFHQPPWVPSYNNLELKQQAKNQPDHDFPVRLLSVERPSIRTSDSCNVRKQTEQLCTGSSSDINVDCLDNRGRHDSSLAEASGSNSAACSSSVIITPDHVVNVMGEKQFWLARRAIMNQQRMFAAQVFELHRLVRVQRLMAHAPDLLLDDKPPTAGGLIEGEGSSPRAGPPDHNGPPPGTCLLQAGNQWLVPVMSPSEGLVYKPYSRTLSSSGGFMASPFYTECGAAMNPPYGMVMPRAANSPPHDHRSSRFLARSKEDVSIPCRSSSSSNMSSTKSGLVMMQVQSGGSNNNNYNNAVLSLFPLEPTKNNVETCDASKTDHRMMDREEQRVIKVIPRNPRLATESAAKIFDLIQEERKRKFNQLLG
ncbi:Protein EARLY FLOWERING 3 [Linum grandiflorum]